MGRFAPLAIAGCLAMAGITVTTRAQGQIAWESTFNCPEWTQSDGLNDANVCNAGDSITGSGGWTTASGKMDQITTAANNPSGGGGRGFRHWRGGASAGNILGQNNNGGGIKIDVPGGGRNELWIRWYMRYQQGFAWQYVQYTKDLYANVGGTGAFTVGFHGVDDWGVSIVLPASQNLFGSPGWQSTMGAVGDGRWHAYEVHIKTTSPTVAESWIDGRQSHRHTNVNFGGVPINHFVLGSNQCCVAVQPDMYTDYDDVAISFSGYIGPVGGASAPTGPAAPANLRITL